MAALTAEAQELREGIIRAVHSLLGLLLMDRCAGVLEVGTSLALEREQSHHS